ncbi:hypothetical protein [Blastochloris tepida]|uniref:Uncharacterized protein n=1 Tax=Blastochloris tepida TaxID=2233851 RepID=A0A348G1E7_9HYPH|nr:hypothetical protein [Blastochloris tepida]BBF93380.1 hypothetical protein BLTE_20650 [Blastochloris tepida]
MANKVRATAVFSLTLEVDAESIWEPTCTVGQIQDQALVEAAGKIQQLPNLIPGLRMTGEPTLSAVVCHTRPSEA